MFRSTFEIRTGRYILRTADTAPALGSAISSNNFLNPYTMEPMTALEAVRLCGFWRRLIDSNREISAGAGFASGSRNMSRPCSGVVATHSGSCAILRKSGAMAPSLCGGQSSRRDSWPIGARRSRLRGSRRWFPPVAGLRGRLYSTIVDNGGSSRCALRSVKNERTGGSAAKRHFCRRLASASKRTSSAYRREWPQQVSARRGSSGQKGHGAPPHSRARAGGRRSCRADGRMRPLL